MNSNSKKDWQEDFHLENGNYSNRCSLCSGEFMGHKRRFVCKECEEESRSKTADAILSQKIGNAIFEMVEAIEDDDRNFALIFEQIAKDYAQMKIEEEKSRENALSSVLLVGGQRMGKTAAIIEILEKSNKDVIVISKEDLDNIKEESEGLKTIEPNSLLLNDLKLSVNVEEYKPKELGLRSKKKKGKRGQIGFNNKKYF